MKNEAQKIISKANKIKFGRSRDMIWAKSHFIDGVLFALAQVGKVEELKSLGYEGWLVTNGFIEQKKQEETK